MTDPTTIRLLAVTVTFLVAGILACGLGAAVRRLLFGGAALRTPMCGRCKSLVRGSGISVPERCSECGNATRTPGSVRWVYSPRRTTLATLGGGMLTAVIAIAVLASAIVLAPGPLAKPVSSATPTLPSQSAATATVPNVEAIAARLTGDDSGPALTQIDYQLVRDPLSQPLAETSSLFDALVAHGTHRRNSALLAKLAIAIVRDDPTTADRMRTQLANALPRTMCMMTPCVHSGADVTIALLHQTNAPESWMRLNAVRLQGKPQDLVGPTATGAIVTGKSSAAWRFSAPLVPGAYEIEIDWWADWPLSNTGTETEDVGLLPQRETTRCTLTVTADPERIVRRTGPDTIDLHALVESPYVVVQPNGQRGAIWFRLPNVPTRFAGDWSIESDGAWVPLIERSGQMDPFDIVCVSFAETPRRGWPERLRIRFSPAAAPVDSLPTDPMAVLLSGGVTPARALDSAWGKAIELAFKRWNDTPSRKTYQLETVRTLPFEQAQ